MLNDFPIGIVDCRGGMGGMARLGIEIVGFVEEKVISGMSGAGVGKTIRKGINEVA